MKQITITLMFCGALTFISNRMFSQQDSSKTLSPSEQVNYHKAQDAATIDDLKNERDNAKEVAKDAQQLERDASDASKQSKSALKSERKAQKARKRADQQSIKAEKARNKSTM